MIGFFVIYVITFSVAIYYDRRNRVTEKNPSPEELRHSVDTFYRMCGRQVDVVVFETQHLEEWERVYEIHRGKDESDKPRFWDLLRVHLRDGFRQSHLYLSVFFTPLQGLHPGRSGSR